MSVLYASRLLPAPGLRCRSRCAAAMIALSRRQLTSLPLSSATSTRFSLSWLPMRRVRAKGWSGWQDCGRAARLGHSPAAAAATMSDKSSWSSTRARLTCVWADRHALSETDPTPAPYMPSMGNNKCLRANSVCPFTLRFAPQFHPTCSHGCNMYSGLSEAWAYLKSRQNRLPAALVQPRPRGTQQCDLGELLCCCAGHVLLLVLTLLHACIKVKAADQQHLPEVWHGSKGVLQQQLQDSGVLQGMREADTTAANVDTSVPETQACPAGLLMVFAPLTSACSCCTYRVELCL